MKPNSFSYVKAQSLTEVLAHLAEHGDDARILAGGQSLIPAMNMRMAVAETLVDVSAVAELQGIRQEEDHLTIGAMARHVEVLNSPLVAEHAPLIAKAMPNIAHATIRNRGTFGGSLCNADPASELPACVLAMDAKLNIQNASGARTVAAEDFFEAVYTTCLAEDELLLSVDVPNTSSSTVTFFEEVSRRKGDYAMAGLAARADVLGGRLSNLRLAFFAVGDRPLRAISAESLLNGITRGELDLGALSSALSSDITPEEDLTTSGEAKAVIMRVLLRKAVTHFFESGASS